MTTETKQEPVLARSPLTGEIYITTSYGPHPEVPSGIVAHEKYAVSAADLRDLGLVPASALSTLRVLHVQVIDERDQAVADRDALVLQLECSRARMQAVQLGLEVAMPAELAGLYEKFRSQLAQGMADIDRTLAGVRQVTTPLVAARGSESDAEGEGSRSAGESTASPSAPAIAGGGA